MTHTTLQHHTRQKGKFIIIHYYPLLFIIIHHYPFGGFGGDVGDIFGHLKVPGTGFGVHFGHFGVFSSDQPQGGTKIPKAH